MKHQTFMEKLARKREEGKYVCVGLDTDFSSISFEIIEFLRRKRSRSSPSLGVRGPAMLAFNRAIIWATSNIAACYKLNRAFYEGKQGIWALDNTVKFLHEIAPNVPWIFDAKYGDIGNISRVYARYVFHELGADAVTVNPYGGRADGIDAFLEYKDKGIFVWCRGSNEGSRELQDIGILTWRTPGGSPEIAIHQLLAERISGFNEYTGVVRQDGWNKHGNCGLVVGATHPNELEGVRGVAGDMPILIPGIGAQGGDLAGSVKAALYISPTTGEKSLPAIFNASRSIIYASGKLDFAEIARKKTEELNSNIRDTLRLLGGQ